MLAIGRALMSKPRLLLLDEPSLGLAPLVVRQIFGAIRALNAETGLTVLLVEQNANQALRLAHRGYVLVNGRDHHGGARRGRCWPGRRSATPISAAGTADTCRAPGSATLARTVAAPGLDSGAAAPTNRERQGCSSAGRCSSAATALPVAMGFHGCLRPQGSGPIRIACAGPLTGSIRRLRRRR